MHGNWNKYLTGIIFIFLILFKIPGVLASVLPTHSGDEVTTELLIDMEKEEEKKSGRTAETSTMEDFFEEPYLLTGDSDFLQKDILTLSNSIAGLSNVCLDIPTPPPNSLS